MSQAPDILVYIEREFPPEDRAAARALLATAVLHDGNPAGPRCLRSALVGARGSLRELERLVALLRVDFRDVIVAGECEGRGRDLRQVRDLTRPFPMAGGGS